MNKVNRSRRILISSLLVMTSLFIIIYQLKFSESARIGENLKNFDRVKDFFSTEVDKKDIENIKRDDNSYSFTIEDKDTMDNFRKLGRVDMLDGDGDLISDFILLKNNDDYVIFMRNVYMSVD